MFYVLRGRGGQVRLSPIRTFRGHSGDVLAMAFSASDFLLTASMDRCVRLWHADTQLCLRRFVHPDIVTAVAFHPADENYVISGACDGKARIWKPADHACVAEEHVGAVVTAAEFAADGSAAFVGTFDGHVKVLDVKGLVAGDDGSQPMASADLAAGRSASDDDLKPAPGLGVKRSVDIRATRGGRGKAGGVAGMAVDARRGEVVVSGSDGRVTVVRGGTGAEIVGKMKVGGKKGEAGGVRLGGSVSADGQFLVFDGVGGVVRVVELEEGRGRDGGRKKETVVGLEGVRVMETGGVSCAAFATRKAVEVAGLEKEKGGLLIAVGGDDGVIRIVGVPDGVGA